MKKRDKRLLVYQLSFIATILGVNVVNIILIATDEDGTPHRDDDKGYDSTGSAVIESIAEVFGNNAAFITEYLALILFKMFTISFLFTAMLRYYQARVIRK